MAKMRMSSAEMNRVLRRLPGFEVAREGKGHPVLRHAATGEPVRLPGTGQPITLPLSPSNPGHAARKFERDCRKAGLIV